MDNKLIIKKNQHGAYDVDIVGLMHILKHQLVPLQSTVIACMDPKGGQMLYLDTYIVEESLAGGYILLYNDEDMDNTVAHMNQLPGVSVAQLSMPEDVQAMIDELDDEEETPYLELDDMMMAARYLVYPKGLIDKAQLFNKESYAIIHYEEALHRLKNGESVFVDYNNEDTFKRVAPNSQLTPEMILKGVWAISETSEAKDVASDKYSLNDLNERLEAFLSSVTSDEEEVESLSDITHDAEMLDFLNKLKDFFTD